MPAQFTSNRNNVSDCSCGYVAVGVFDNNDFTASASEVDRKSGGAIKALVASGDLDKSPGSCTLLHAVKGIKAKRALVVRLGSRKKFDAQAFLKAMKGIGDRLRSHAGDSIAVFIDDMPVDDRDLEWQAKRAVETISDNLYEFNQLKKEGRKRKRSWRVQISSGADGTLSQIRSGVKVGKAVSDGVSMSKDLGNLPGNICTPTYLAERAKELGEHDNVTVETLEEADMEKLGMGALLSVSKGSREPAKLIIIDYRGGDEDSPPVALVGKGLTFDAGGISIKPASAMDEMKFDMCGAAGVIGALSMAASLKLPLNVLGVIASSENLPDGAANKPGDIVTSMSGTTIEVLNTDAEGRLILCDALTYTERYKPAVVIDAATLTGACVIALGRHPSGLFSNDDALADELVEAGEVSGDRVWRLPVWDDYQEMLSSNFADLANIGGRPAGAVTAACFLANFTKKFRWAHLDIAGTAWNTGKQKGSTGRPVYLFAQFLLGRCQEAD